MDSITVRTESAVIRIDHVVVPTDDLGKVLGFYTGVLGGRLDRLTNVNQRGLAREVPMMAFLTVANQAGFGVALQATPLPEPNRPGEGVVTGFEVSQDDWPRVLDHLQQHSITHQGPWEFPSPSPIAASVWVSDPRDVTFEICVRRGDPWPVSGQGVLQLRRISHVRLEVTDLAEGQSWYRSVLGLQPAAAVPGEHQVTLEVTETGQLFILHEVSALSPRSQYSRGPHVHVDVPVGTFPQMVRSLNRIERYWGPNANRIPWHEPDPQTVYFYDPFGNRLQMAEPRKHH